ncbi:MAG: Stealth CR1 domain-containing protein [bacterium]
MSSNQPIDIVIPWVDGSDPEWQREFKKYSFQAMGRDDNSEIRYRDWDNLQYLFRGIEKFTPWVRKVHFITTGQKPKWLNLDAPKLHFVKHEDFIPKEWLPTFSVRPIELNLHRIEELSEQFIYFNDDYFLLKPVKKERFFRGGLPCDMAMLDTLNTGSSRSHVILNNVIFANRHFNKNKVIKSNTMKWLNPIYGTQMLRTLALMSFSSFPGFRNHHMPQAYLKSTFQKVWAEEKELLEEVSSHRFRDITDVNQYVFRYWQLLSGQFVPINIVNDSYRFRTSEDEIDKLVAAIKGQKRKVLVTYDSENISDFEALKNRINQAFEEILPDKSSFEI